MCRIILSKPFKCFWNPNALNWHIVITNYNQVQQTTLWAEPHDYANRPQNNPVFCSFVPSEIHYMLFCKGVVRLNPLTADCLSERQQLWQWHTTTVSRRLLCAKYRQPLAECQRRSDYHCYCSATWDATCPYAEPHHSRSHVGTQAHANTGAVKKNKSEASVTA